MKFAPFVAATALLALSACGADGNDAFSAPADDGAAAPRTVPATPVESSVASDPTASPSTVAPAAPNGEVVQVRSLDNTFRAADIEVVAGTEVWWTNNGRNDHNVLPVDPEQPWGVDTEDFAPGDEYRRVFDTPGTYLYFCSIHGTETVGMVGSVSVVGADA